jgi:hypothetical protein|tara:strand:+ start:507 stop:680 length:174 start_codon:yes stop_codon:yes gene_type:complete
MARRYKIGKYYVIRRKNGTFQRWTRIGRSLKADRRSKAKTKVKSGYGYKGDQRKSRR